MRDFKDKIIYMWEHNPLPLLLCVGAFFRLLAVLFSKGFGMHDDHFLVIEAAQSWVDGSDYNSWLPTISKGVTKATGHSLLYPGFHYSLFYLLQKAGMMDPQIKMYVVRFLHAAFSLLVIVAGYKIAYKCGGLKSARESGLLLAILFFMPMLSVRNLAEVVCSVPLLLATWYVIKSEKENWKHALLAGMMLGIAFSVRFQTVFFLSGFALALLLLKQWKNFFYVCAGFIISVGVIQTFTDIIIWKRPFMELAEYVRYNIENKETYGVSAWHKFLLLTSGILIPPMSLLIITGFLSSWKKNLILFLPAFLFFVAHSLIPNKQERFILPIIPFIVIAGIIGWNNMVIKFDKKIWLQKLTRISWIVFFILNTIPLFVVSVSYSKRSRVEAMYYLYKKNDTKTVLVEESIHDDAKMPPLFYFGKWGSTYSITRDNNVNSFFCGLNFSEIEQLPQYVVFNQIDSLDSRVEAFKKYFPHISYEATIEPGFLDKILNKLNPKNANFTCYIYKINYNKQEMEEMRKEKCLPL